MNKQNINNHHLAVLKKINKLHKTVLNKKQLQLIDEIANEGLIGEEALSDLLIRRLIIDTSIPDYLDGLIFQVLNKTSFHTIKQNLNNYFPNGIIKFQTNLTIDYQPLQGLLINEDFQEADKLTQLFLCKLAGIYQKSKRNWLYFTDIPLLPIQDLYTIDLLWRIYSGGKFGFSVQREIWLANDGNWERLWHKIGWKKEGVSSRYPNEFIWNTGAPYGHLPLFNQLRGVQVLNALFNHIIWS